MTREVGNVWVSLHTVQELKRITIQVIVKFIRGCTSSKHNGKFHL